MPIEQTLADVVRPLVSNPDAVHIAQSSDELGILFTVQVAQEDMGSVIGKEGETAKAIRHIVRVAGMKQNKRVSVKFNEPDGSRYVPKKRSADAELLA